jgi:hypothetical protein
VLGGLFHPTRFSMRNGPAIEFPHRGQKPPATVRGNPAFVRHGENSGMSAQDDEQQGGSAVAATDDEDGFGGDFCAAKKFVSEIGKPGFEDSRGPRKLICGIICSSFTNVRHVVSAASPRSKGYELNVEVKGQNVCQSVKRNRRTEKWRWQTEGAGAVRNALIFSRKRPQADMGSPPFLQMEPVSASLFPIHEAIRAFSETP